MTIYGPNFRPQVGMVKTLINLWLSYFAVNFDLFGRVDWILSDENSKRPKCHRRRAE